MLPAFTALHLNWLKTAKRFYRLTQVVASDTREVTQCDERNGNNEKLCMASDPKSTSLAPVHNLGLFWFTSLKVLSKSRKETHPSLADGTVCSLGVSVCITAGTFIFVFNLSRVKPLTSVALSITDAGVVSLGGAKNLCREHHGSHRAACNRAERALSSLQPRLLQQQRLHLSALPTWNPLRWHLR